MNITSHIFFLILIELRRTRANNKKPRTVLYNKRSSFFFLLYHSFRCILPPPLFPTRFLIKNFLRELLQHSPGCSNLSFRPFLSKYGSNAFLPFPLPPPINTSCTIYHMIITYSCTIVQCDKIRIIRCNYIRIKRCDHTRTTGYQRINK